MDKDAPKRGLESNRVNKIPVSAIHEMTRLSAQVPDPAFLSWAKPTSGTPEHINQVACEAIRKGLVSGYSPSSGMPELRSAVVEKLKRDNNIDADPSEVLVTVGAIEGLSAAVMALVDPGDEVLVPSPNYSTHAQQVVLASAVPVYVPTIEEEGFCLDVDAFREAVTDKTKAIMFCTPSNPTGAVFEEKDLHALADIALEHDLAVITDESYEYFTFDNTRHFSIASISEMRERTISCFTFTKTYAMTGWRIGYAACHNELSMAISKIQSHSTSNPTSIAQKAAVEALKGPQNQIEEMVKAFDKRRKYVISRLNEIEGIRCLKPEGAFYAFPNISTFKITPHEFASQLLTDQLVALIPGEPFGANQNIRISYAASLKDLEESMNRIEKFCSNLV